MVSALTHSLLAGRNAALLAAGWDVPRVMAHIGHATHSMTLGTYGNVLELSEAERAELRGLVEGRWAQSGPKNLEALALEAVAPPPVSAQEQCKG
jgi:hypothetical protein